MKNLFAHQVLLYISCPLYVGALSFCVHCNDVFLHFLDFLGVCHYLRKKYTNKIDKHMQGYSTKQHGVAVKRYCRTMNLKADDALIREYIHRHSEGQVWPEILEGIRSVGILEMEIYLLGNRLFMIVETPLDFDWDSAMERLATLPRQQEWEDYMSIFQDCREGDTADEKWMMMDQIFHLYE